MADKETIQTEVARIKQLRADYDALIMDINSHRTIEAYHKWYEHHTLNLTLYSPLRVLNIAHYPIAEVLHAATLKRWHRLQIGCCVVVVVGVGCLRCGVTER